MDDGIVTSKVTEEDIVELIDNIREIDRLEVWYLNALEPEAAIRQSVEESEFCAAARLEETGELICIYGVSSISILGKVGAPWMLGTDAVAKIPFGLVRRTRHAVKSVLRNRYDLLINTIWDKNEATKRYLRACGFKFGPVHKTLGGEPYRRFTMEK